MKDWASLWQVLPSTWLCKAKLLMFGSEATDFTLSQTASDQQVADLTPGCLAPVLGLFLIVFPLMHGLLPKRAAGKP